MKIVIVIVLVLAGVGMYFNKSQIADEKLVEQKQEEILPIKVIAEGLDTPWGIVILPDGGMLVTERMGRVRLVNKEGKLQTEPVAVLEKVEEIGEGGLLGIALHPNFLENNLVYLYYTYRGNGGKILNRVMKMVYRDGILSNEQIVLDEIPGSKNHNGGRIKFDPDGNLYVTTGDAETPILAQDKNSLAGKILRVSDSGETTVYSYGHRNPQGLAWDDKGLLWSVEHGPSGGRLGTGNDEINIIKIGANYGWPEIQGDQIKVNMETPVLNSTPKVAWAPAGVAYFNGSLYFAGLRGNALYEYKIEENKLIEHFKSKYGRLREVVLGTDNYLYVTTSNRDGRGKPESTDDRIIRIDLKIFNKFLL